MTLETWKTRLASQGYVASEKVSMSVFLAESLKKPLLLEGVPGVGKTSLALAVSQVLERPLIRLQCHPSLDFSSAVYDWNIAKQMLKIRLNESVAKQRSSAASSDLDVDTLYSKAYLSPRPLLKALMMSSESGQAPVLLIDEIDRADESFEAVLLEILAEYAITIPEMGTIIAKQPPIVFLTSNQTREIHDALRRRCMYCWLDYPSFKEEKAILLTHGLTLSLELIESIISFIHEVRDIKGLYKPPGSAELIDWAKTLALMGVKQLNPELIGQTVGVFLKYQDDIDKLTQSSLQSLLSRRHEA